MNNKHYILLFFHNPSGCHRSYSKLGSTVNQQVNVTVSTHQSLIIIQGYEKGVWGCCSFKASPLAYVQTRVWGFVDLRDIFTGVSMLNWL